ncbi:head-tail adaptor protein [Pseudohoeflea suaedae]|uniref:Head-tail adaptor protein n=1 Tax=Pseudohoeflea suaedae TaxID=877384 RepID=A0A4R5PQD7_9HYPH|nr:phage head closure protein [Pseudohoeflea suaedae]TDH38847.1 head-tail adaptor protein [Pseudohoeflea suaedae]
MRRSFNDPGWLDARLTLEVPSEAADGQGGATRDWVSVAGLWGAVHPVSVRPGEEAAVANATLTHRVTIRARDDVLRGMRFSWRGRVLAIEAVSDPDESGAYLDCMCREMAP